MLVWQSRRGTRCDISPRNSKLQLKRNWNGSICQRVCSSSTIQHVSRGLPCITASTFHTDEPLAGILETEPGADELSLHKEIAGKTNQFRWVPGGNTEGDQRVGVHVGIANATVGGL